jgi:hypothetical protein
MNEAGVEIIVFQDGENVSPEREAIDAAIKKTWTAYYSSVCPLRIELGSENLKKQSDAAVALPKLREIYVIRNPDIYFVARKGDVTAELGGVEITTHSPDGSNVDKRYPFLWAAGQWSVHAFVATPYMKQRSSGQQNCLPHRHASRNKTFLDDWDPNKTEGTSLRQILPVRELQVGAGHRLPASVADEMLGWDDIGAFFAHDAATKLLGKAEQAIASKELARIKTKLARLISASLANTTKTKRSSLIVQPSRWIQVYNCRPETGHWERGEGQFDSIDGRLMFTADELSEMAGSKRPSLEFWLPQMTSHHPWIVEQRSRNFGSKRLRNLLVVLAPLCTTKFADQLSNEDWVLLRQNRQVLLERLDWVEGVYRIADLVSNADVSRLARHGLINVEPSILSQVQAHLKDGHLYYATYRPYSEDWDEALFIGAKHLGKNCRVLVPRIPRRMLKRLSSKLSCQLIPAEDCTRSELMAIRQLERHNPKHRKERGRGGH